MPTTSPACTPALSATEKVGVLSDVALSVLDDPESLAGIRSGAPTVAATVTRKVVLVLTEPSLTVMVMMDVPVRPATGVMAREFCAFAGALGPVAPVPGVRTRPLLGISAVLLEVMV